MRASTGRAVSAAIHSHLREALADGTPKTYAQLAASAGCTVRSVRNYLERCEDIFGFRIERYRDGGHSLMVQAVATNPAELAAPVAAPDSPVVADAFATALADALLPNRPGAADRRALASSFLLFSFRGLPVLGPHQCAVLQAWIDACASTSPRPVRLRLVDGAPGAPELSAWPVAAVVHNVEGIQLLALPLEADSSEGLRTVDLSLVENHANAFSWIESAESVEPPFDFKSLNLAEMFGSPFSACAGSDAPLVQVHVRFAAAFAPVVQSRLWHSNQRAVVRRDGCVDLRFGPVRLDAAASWVASLGRAVEVVGDKKLRKAVKKRSFEAV